MAKQFICSVCGSVDNPKRAIKGNGAIELILWLAFLVPGLIYSIWRSSSRHSVCTVCGGTTLIPLDSPIGAKLLADQGKTIEGVRVEIQNRKMPVGKKIFIGFLVFVALLVIVGVMTIGTS